MSKRQAIGSTQPRWLPPIITPLNNSFRGLLSSQYKGDTMKANESELYNQEKRKLDLDIDYVVQVKYISKQAACLTRLHLTKLGYEAEVIKVAV